MYRHNSELLLGFFIKLEWLRHRAEYDTGHDLAIYQTITSERFQKVLMIDVFEDHSTKLRRKSPKC